MPFKEGTKCRLSFLQVTGKANRLQVAKGIPTVAAGVKQVVTRSDTYARNTLIKGPTHRHFSGPPEQGSRPEVQL